MIDMSELLDEEGYPTEYAIQQIKNYPVLNEGKVEIEGLLEILSSMWYFGDWGFIKKEDTLELHTGGWSGNEEIIRALQESFFWTLFWESSRRGGHYYFDGLNKFN